MWPPCKETVACACCGVMTAARSTTNTISARITRQALAQRLHRTAHRGKRRTNRPTCRVPFLPRWRAGRIRPPAPAADGLAEETRDLLGAPLREADHREDRGS